MNHWHKLISREGVDLTSISGFNRVFFDIVQRYTKSKQSLFFTYFRNRQLTHYLKIDQYQAGKFIYSRYVNTPKKIKALYEFGEKFLTDTKAKTTEWQKKIGKDPAPANLRKAFLEFRSSFNIVNYKFSILPWWGIEAWQEDFEQLTGKLLSRVRSGDRDLILKSLSVPWKKTALLKLAEDSKKLPVAKLIEKYQFLRSWAVVWYRPINKAWLKDFQSTVKVASEKLLSINKIIQLVKANKTEEQQLRLAPYIIFFKDYRDDLRRIHAYQWHFMFDAMADYFKVPVDDIGFLSLDDIDEMLRTKKFPAGKVRSRKAGPCVVVRTKILESKILDDGLAQYENIISHQAKMSGNTKSVTGLAAQHGKVTGQVILIKTFHDIKKVKANHIMVSNTTHPNYLPGMQKALAFVTNEGGIASHAAIVARELKKPCIVGTKNATSIFKDGDIIEVDADQGIARLLK